jgi:hypothetical protein
VHGTGPLEDGALTRQKKISCVGSSDCFAASLMIADLPSAVLKK